MCARARWRPAQQPPAPCVWLTPRRDAVLRVDGRPVWILYLLGPDLPSHMSSLRPKYDASRRCMYYAYGTACLGNVRLSDRRQVLVQYERFVIIVLIIKSDKVLCIIRSPRSVPCTAGNMSNDRCRIVSQAILLSSISTNGTGSGYLGLSSRARVAGYGIGPTGTIPFVRGIQDVDPRELPCALDWCTGRAQSR